jgi:hypothetical protein
VRRAPEAEASGAFLEPPARFDKAGPLMVSLRLLLRAKGRSSTFYPITDDDVPGIVALMNRAYRGAGAAGWSTQESYLSGDRITEDVLRSDLLAKPEASLLKWEDREGGSLLGCDAGLRPRKVSCARSRGRRNAQSRGKGEAGK